jgi:signal transduction histidine kinase
VVRDDGRGFVPQEGGAGFGLVGMRERVTLARGTLDVSSTPDGGGTVLTVALPVRRRAADEERVAQEGASRSG